MKEKKERILYVGSVYGSLADLEKELEYARRQARLYDPEIKDSDITLFLDENTLKAKFKSLENDKEEQQRLQEEWVISELKKAKDAGLNEFLIDCNGSPDKVSAAASALTKLRYSSDWDCILSGCPVFDETGVFQTGIKVTFFYKK